MSNNKGPTTTFHIDIAELKKGIQEAKRQIQLANAEFKAVSSTMDNWAQSTDGVRAKINQLNTTATAQQRILNSLELEYRQVCQEQGETSTGAEQLRIRIANQQAAVNRTRREIQNWENALGNIESESDRVETASESLNSEIKEQQDKLKELKKKYTDVVLAQGENSEEARELAGQISSLSSELSENRNRLSAAEQAADELDNSLEDVGESADDANDGFTSFKATIANLAANVVQELISALKDLAVSCINVGKEFDSAMAQVSAVSGATGEDLQTLRDKAKEMGANTKFSATEAADAFNYMAMAGWKTEDMLGGIEGILSLAAAGNTDLATTSDIVTDALTAMGESAGEAGRLADVMAAASSNSNTNVEMMGETFKYVGTLVGALDYEMEDAALAIGLMANSGVKAEQAGTSLRSILTRLAAPPKQAAEAMEELGLSMRNEKNEMKSFDEIILDLREAFKGLANDEDKQAEMAKKLAGTSGMSGLLAIVNATEQDFNKLSTAINNSTGVAANMAATMQNNLGGDLTALGSKFEGVQLTIYEKFEPALRKGVEVLSKLLDVVNFLIAHGTEVKAVLAGMATAVATYLAYTAAITIMKEGWRALTVVQKAVTAAQWLMNVAMAANPIGIVVALIAGLVAAFIVLWNKSDKFREFWINLWEKVKAKFEAAWEAICKFFTETVPAAFSNLINWIKANWSTILLLLISPFAGLFKYFYENNTQFKGFVDNVITSIKELPGKLWEWLLNAINRVKEWALNMAESAKEAGSNFIQSIITFYKELPEKIGYILGFVLGKIIQWNTNVYLFITKKVPEIIEKVVKFYSELPGKLWTWLLKTVAKVSAWKTNMENKAKEAGKAFIDKVISFVKELPGKVWIWLTGTLEKINTWKTNTTNKAKETGKAFIDKVISFVKELPGKVWTWLVQTIAKINAWKTKLVEKGKEAAKGLFDSIVDTVKGLPDKIKEIGGNIVKGLWDGINNMKKWLSDKVKSFCDGITKGIKDSFDIHSPSRVMRDEVGKYLALGIAEGITKNKDAVSEAMQALKNDIAVPIDLGISTAAVKSSIVGSARASYGTKTENIINNNDYNFYQYNTSPKALSRLEIYRQTRNQLKMARI